MSGDGGKHPRHLVADPERRQRAGAARKCFTFLGCGNVGEHSGVKYYERRIARRLRAYSAQIQARHGIPVLSIVLILRGGKPGPRIEVHDERRECGEDGELRAREGAEGR